MIRKQIPETKLYYVIIVFEWKRFYIQFNEKYFVEEDEKIGESLSSFFSITLSKFV